MKANLCLFLKPSRDVLWLEDPDQNVRDQSAMILPEFVGYRARTNYRSPESIARFITRALSVRFECGNDLPGLGVGVTPYTDAADQPAAVARIIGALLQRGFSHGDIAVLTTRHVTTPGGERSIFSTRERVGNYRLNVRTHLPSRFVLPGLPGVQHHSLGSTASALAKCAIDGDIVEVRGR